MLLISNVHSQSLGFEETECGIVSNSSYYIENYQLGSHGYGYRLHHNGITIYDQYGEYGGYSASYLRFINDSVGFFVVYEVTAQIHVFKIIGNNVTPFGYGSGSCVALFIVNANTAYIAVDYSWFVGQEHLFINKCSDIQPQKILIEDLSVTTDVTIMDTIVGMPLCDSLSELNYKYVNGNDTVNYKILFSIIDSTYSIKEHITHEWKVFPNPTVEYIHLKTNNPSNPYKIKIFNSVGIIQRSMVINSLPEQTIYVGDLEKGMYIIEINQGKMRQYNKIIKI